MAASGWSSTRLKKAALLFSAPLLTVLLVDGAVRFLLRVEPPGHRVERYVQFSPLTGHFSRPNADFLFNRYDDGRVIRIRTNSFGFTDVERAVTKVRPRIALIGDSTTASWEVDERERPHFVMERLLHHKAEVLNFGVRGYGTDQTYLLFENVGVHFSPDVVIYTFCINDLNDNAQRHSKPYYEIHPQTGSLMLRGYPIRIHPAEETRDWADRLFEESFCYRQGRAFLNGLFYDPPPLERHFQLRPYKRTYDDDDRYRMELTLRLISQLNSYVTGRGMKFMVVEGVYRPTIDAAASAGAVATYGDIFDFDRVSETLAAHCERSGIPFLSLPQVLRRRTISANEVMHWKDQLHLNARGLALSAREIVQKLRSLGWLKMPPR